MLLKFLLFILIKATIFKSPDYKKIKAEIFTFFGFKIIIVYEQYQEWLNHLIIQAFPSIPDIHLETLLKLPRG